MQQENKDENKDEKNETNQQALASLRIAVLIEHPVFARIGPNGYHYRKSHGREAQ